jgi:hypothetical protein
MRHDAIPCVAMNITRTILFVQSLALLGVGCRSGRPTIPQRTSEDSGVIEDTGVATEPEDSGVALVDTGVDTMGLRSDLCPEAQPQERAPCVERKYCIYPQGAMQGTSCRCLLGDEARQQNQASNEWRCGPYQFVGVGPLAPPELDG